MKKSLQKLINSFLDRVQLELKPIYLHCGKEEYLKVRKKDIRGNYKLLVKKGAISLKRNPDGNSLIATKIDQEAILFFSLYPDYKAEYLVPKWWHKLIFWKKFKYQPFNMKRQFVSIKDIL